MIAVILNYESQQNPAYRSTLARAFLRDFQSHLFVILPPSLTYVSYLVLNGIPQFKLLPSEQSPLAIGTVCQSDKLTLQPLRCLQYF